MKLKVAITSLAAALCLLAHGGTVSPSSSVVLSYSSGLNIYDETQISLTGSQWYLSGAGHFSMINNTSAPVDLSVTPIIITGMPSGYMTDIWSIYINSTWYQPVKVKDGEFTVTGGILPVNGELAFDLTLSASGSSLVPGIMSIVASVGNPPSHLDGAIEITFNSINGSPAPSSATITLSSDKLSSPIVTNITSFTSTLNYTSLPYGSYTLSASNLPAGYTMTFSSQNLTIDNSTAKKVTASYELKEDPNAAVLTIKLGSKPISNTANIVVPDSVSVTVTNTSTSEKQIQSLSWSNAVKFNVLKNTAYTITADSITNGTTVYTCSKSTTITSKTQTITLSYAKKSSLTTKTIDFFVKGLVSGSGSIVLKTTSYSTLTFTINNLVNGSNPIVIPAGTYTVSVQSAGGQTGSAANFDASKVTTENITYNAADSGQIYYHVTFPVTITGSLGVMPLTDNYRDLIMSNFVAGSMLGHLIRTDSTYGNLKFSKDYLYGTILGQLLQETIDASIYNKSSDFITSIESYRNTLLSPGQGGPYQLNDYSKELESGYGLINFAVLQKSLGYSVKDQGTTQTSKKGPDSLDNKYFGPLAAAYFHYNDILRLQAINKETWGPSYAYFGTCMKNLESASNSFLDMILNAAYNAGPYSNICKRLIELGANINNSSYATAIANINNYSINDTDYRNKTGINESNGSTFILYPRQVRFYLDQLYNNSTGLTANSSLVFSLSQLKYVFSKDMNTLAYLNSSRQYVFISLADGETAFSKAVTSQGLTLSDSLNISNAQDRAKIFAILDGAIDNLAKTLNIKFGEITKSDMGSL